MGIKIIARTGAAAFMMGAVLVLVTAPAGASVTGPCNGQATINGKTYTPANDSASNPIVIPKSRTGVVTYHGDTGSAVITNHHGEVDLVVGPGSIKISSWASANGSHKTTYDGTYNITTGFNKVPVDLVGLYKLKGIEQGTGGSCSGFVMVKLDGNPLGTPAGVASVAITGLAFIGLIFAAFGAKP